MANVNNKINRIQAIISRNVSEIIQFSLRNPKIGMVFIPEVKVSSDFSYAKIYVSFIDEKDIDERMDALNHSKGFIRSELAKRMDTRRVPELIFIKDDTYEKVRHLDEILTKK